MGKTKKSKDEITYHRPNPLMNRNQSKLDARFGPETFFSSIFLPQKDSNYSFDFFAIFAVGVPEENIVQVSLDADVRTWAESSVRFIAVCLTFLCLPETSILQEDPTLEFSLSLKSLFASKVLSLKKLSCKVPAHNVIQKNN